METPHTHFIKMVPQRHKTDCGVCTLAMLCEVSYEEALLAIGQKRVITKGVQLRAVRDAAKKLGRRLVLKRGFDLDTDTGILGIVSETWDFEHLVILKDGMIIDAQDQTVWEHDDYMEAHHAKAVSLLALKE
jgi:ABC-type bacteriocin/lantibiotic exporter with double-glycine peptidase domain